MGIIYALFAPLYSMDHAIVPANEALAKQVIFSNLLVDKVDLCNHDMVCSLAVNKEWEAFLIKTAPIRKALMITKISLLNSKFFEDNDVAWDKYGIACGRKIVCTSNKEKYQCSLESIYWAFNQLQRYESQSWQCTEPMLKDYIKPRFNEEGLFCCYSLGKEGDVMLWDKNQHIIEYCVTRKMPYFSRGDSAFYNKLEENRCGFNLGEGRYNNYALSYFQQFEGIVKAFLNSKVVDKISGFSKLYSLKEAIFPDNYQESNVQGRLLFVVTKFDELPENFKKAITKHYEAQEARQIK